MNGIVPLRFAMDTWAITFQTLIIGPLSPSLATLAKRIRASLEHSSDGYPSAAQLGANKMGELGIYRIYVKFSFLPVPEHAREVLRKACDDAGALFFSISDSLNYQESVKLPYELDESMLDIGLERIRRNQDQMVTNVTEGLDFCLRFIKEGPYP